MSKIKTDPKTHKGRITILSNKTHVDIEIEDESSSSVLLKIRMSPEDFCSAIGRLAYIPCNYEAHHLDRAGKYMVMKNINFPVKKDSRELAIKKALAVPSVLEDGWVPDTHFSSQNSFYYNSDQETYMARTVLRKYVELKEAKVLKNLDGHKVPSLDRDDEG